jgi:hypothetical protein
LCREEAADLCKALKGLNVPVLGIVKEEELPAGTDAKKMRGLVEFQDEYFCGPLFLSDASRTIYQYLGNKPIFTFGTLFGALSNPLKARQEMTEMGERFKEKNIEGNMVGDGLAKGGVLCIAPGGEVKYTFFEDPGKGIPVESREKIVAAVRSFGPLASIASTVRSFAIAN